VVLDIPFGMLITHMLWDVMSWKGSAFSTHAPMCSSIARYWIPRWQGVRNTYALGRLRPEVCREKRYKRFQETVIWKMYAVRGNCI
jgi:hypothetical protein